MKIIMVSIDSLRTTRMSSYGYSKPTTPYLDQIASEGTLFKNAYATDIPTEAVHTAIFSGKTGIRTGIVSHGSALTWLPRTEDWLPSIFRQAGFTTGAVDNLYQLKEWFARGFQYYINSSHPNQRWIDGETVNQLAFPWLHDHKEEDFFLFLHYWDPHTPYLPPKEYIEPFYDMDNKDPFDPHYTSMKAAYNHTAYPFFKHHHFDLIGHVTDAEYVNALYDAEVRYLDEKIKELDEWLDHLGIKEETLLILFGDHGESLTEHDIYWDHCGLYDTTVHVPLIMRWPGYIPAGKKVNGLVQQTDLMPTLLETINNISCPETDCLDGYSLWPSITGRADGTRDKIFLSECAWQAARGIRTPYYKFIRTYDSGPFQRPPRELYNLEQDPAETHNIAGTSPSYADQFDQDLSSWVNHHLKGREDPMAVQLREEGLPFRKRIEKILHSAGITWEEWLQNPSREKLTDQSRKSV
ncbi:sulfatase family protein [Salibacterium aidingense]|uniref:sulfatase family protein n=1 Tax=Salibacterium aidingense TaxID=384933 RepID=UPI000688C2A7|nr:sulfatase [Salibacterium aidingense]